ncbi:MAG: amidohydrolase family protein, partial [Limisphaerales bacterium]
GIKNTWGQGHPIRLLDRSKLITHGMLAIHANILEAKDIQILASHRATMVHCPRSHAFFDHPPFPLHDCLQAGIPVALGTDSLATIKKPAPVHPFHLFHEAKEALKEFPTLRPSTALGMITFQAAKVLGLEKKVGSLAPGMACDWISTSYGGTPEDAAASIIESIPEWDHVVSAGSLFLWRHLNKKRGWDVLKKENDAMLGIDPQADSANVLRPISLSKNHILQK